MKRDNKGPSAGMMSNVALQTPFRCVLSMGNGVLSQKMLDGLLLMLNGEKGGIRKFLSGIPHLIKNIRSLINSI